uniref:Uncharacterized protein n=1 Tax=Medicago truncatula TaxID=3880 RepID=I3SB47_MEDTR|nr:unknown [Medicago truncatula]
MFSKSKLSPFGHPPNPNRPIITNTTRNNTGSKSTTNIHMFQPLHSSRLIPSFSRGKPTAQLGFVVSTPSPKMTLGSGCEGVVVTGVDGENVGRKRWNWCWFVCMRSYTDGGCW